MSNWGFLPEHARAAIRDETRGHKLLPTSGWCEGYLQANVVMLPSAVAPQFKQFCDLNAQACPLLYMSKPGEVSAGVLSRSSDIRTDIPGYRVYRNGKLVEEPSSIAHVWRDDLVCFYLGCSFTFEPALIRAGVPVRNVEQKRTVPMFKTNIKCTPAGIFHTNMVVSMRPVPPQCVQTAVTVSSPLVLAHGGPVHHGDANIIGIADTQQPDFGQSVEFMADDVPVFWACGVTGVLAGVSACTDICLTHAPGCMFIADPLAAEILKPNTNLNDFQSKAKEKLQTDDAALLRGARALFLANRVFVHFASSIQDHTRREIVDLLQEHGKKVEEDAEHEFDLEIAVTCAPKRSDAFPIIRIADKRNDGDELVGDDPAHAIKVLVCALEILRDVVGGV